MAAPIDPIAALTESLAAARLRVATRVEVDGADVHQIDVDRLVWNFAHVEAAIALSEWAKASADPVAVTLADCAQRRALSFMESSDRADSGDLDQRMADLVVDIRPMEDVGAAEEHRFLRSSIHDFASREIAPH